VVEVVRSQEGTSYCALELVPFVLVLTEAMTWVAAWVMVLVARTLLLFLEDMGSPDLEEVVAFGTGMGVLTTYF